jgi:hypothetical protein
MPARYDRGDLCYHHNMEALFGDSRLPERFWSKVCVSANGCWEWTASRHQGYGQFRINAPRAVRGAHRISYEALIGPVVKGLDLDHLCRNRACCNPAHLEPVTRRENLLRGQTLPSAQTLRTHCPSGHPYDGENLILHKTESGFARECRICVQARDRKRSKTRDRMKYYVPRERKRATHCQNGHEFTAENTITKANGSRRCRTCVNIYQRERRYALGITARPEWRTQ